MKLFLKGERCLSPKCAVERRAFPPGMHGKKQTFRRKTSDYGTQLREKQKARRIYGVLERQFNRYFRRATQRVGLTGTNLLVILETRLDNVVYRLGWADSRAQARQLVQHGHVTINGRKTGVPSALVSAGDVVSIRPESMRKTYFKTLREDLDDRQVPRWLNLDVRNISAKVVNLPARDDIDVTINEQLVVEYYSRR